MRLEKLGAKAVRSRNAVRKLSVLDESDLQRVAGGAPTNCVFVDESGSMPHVRSHTGYPPET